MINRKLAINAFKITLLTCYMPLLSQSLQDLQKLKSEYEKFKSGESAFQVENQNLNKMNPITGLPENAIIKSYSFQDTLNQDNYKKNKHFGYNYFTKRDSAFFWENLPTPPSYLLGAGDELVVSLWGETQLRETYTVDREGKIYDDKVGLLNINGKTIEEAKIYLENQFSRVYATLKGRNASTYIDVSLGRLKLININFVGHFSYPGVYPVHPFSNLLTGIMQAGGVDTTGSLREIKIIRNGNIFNIVDIYDFLLKGELSKDIQLRDQDIIFIRPRISSVTIDSAILRPGIYEAKSNESIKNLIDFAGGLKAEASGLISVERIIPLDKRVDNLSSTKNYYIDYLNSKKNILQNGDKIIVNKIFESVNQVELIGQVKKPGKFYFNEGMTILDLIQLGGGLNDSTYWKSIYHKSAELISKDPNSRYEVVRRVDLAKVLNNESENFLLKNLDKLIIHANLNFFERENIQILGEVNIPGSYPVTYDKEPLESFINRAGGLTSRALEDGISIFRLKKYSTETLLRSASSNKLLKSDQAQIFSLGNDDKKSLTKDSDRIRVAWNNDNIPLLPGDSVVVLESAGTVLIQGEVYNPGLIGFEEGKPLKYYIESAGGLTPMGNKNDIIVKYANGVILPKKLFSDPKIKDGSTIIINKKEEKENIDFLGFATSTLSVISTTVTILVLSQQLNNNSQ